MRVVPAAGAPPWEEPLAFGGVDPLCPDALVRVQEVAFDEDQLSVKSVVGGSVSACWPLMVRETVGGGVVVWEVTVMVAEAISWRGPLGPPMCWVRSALKVPAVV